MTADVKLEDVRTWAGFRSAHVARSTGRVVVVLNNAEAGIDDDFVANPWVTVCAAHDTFVTHETLTLARSWASAPEQWCGVCNGTEPDPETDTDETTDTTTTNREEEVMAMKDRIGTRFAVTLNDGETFTGTLTRVRPTGRGIEYLFEDESFSLGAVGVLAAQVAACEEVGQYVEQDVHGKTVYVCTVCGRPVSKSSRRAHAAAGCGTR